jgi:hypothetical protein
MSNNSVKAIHLILLGTFFVGSIVVSTGHALTHQAQEQVAPPAAKPAGASATGASTPYSTPYRNQPAKIANREAAYYEAVWGIEAPNVKAVEEGVILRFSYHVLDPVKAKPLFDKKLNPVLECPDKGIRLVIPSMEKVGQLRQAPPQIEGGKSYWMAFSNTGRPLKAGDRVDIVIGNFHARGLQVE